MGEAPADSYEGEDLAYPWIGLVEVVPGEDLDRESQLPRDRGAFSVFVAFGIDKNGALARVARECELMNIEVVEYEDVEPLEERLSRVTLDDDLLEMIDWMFENKIGASLVQLNTFPLGSE